MNKRFEIILILSVILIIILIGVGISVQYKKPENNYSTCCDIEERDSESNNIVDYQSSFCEVDENNSNYEISEENYPSCCKYDPSTYYDENYRSRCY
jgi:hypothetical protein